MNFVLANDSGNDAAYMRLALAEAKKAVERDEVPVGAIIIHKDAVVGAGYNRREELQSPLAHAEILAIEQASRQMGSWRLSECRLYVTLEPCVMCVGAILQARIGALVFGCLDPKAGAVESLYRLCDDNRLNHRLPARGGVLADACAELLEEFFTRLREKKRQEKTAERWPSPAEGA
jgi:tRNA(adenine34) deaminase